MGQTQLAKKIEYQGNELFHKTLIVIDKGYHAQGGLRAVQTPCETFKQILLQTALTNNRVEAFMGS